MDKSVQFRLVKPVFFLLRASSIATRHRYFLNLQKRDNFCLKGSYEYLLRMSVTETSLPELRNLFIFSVKTEMAI